jgi:hypothetical protein
MATTTTDTAPQPASTPLASALWSRQEANRRLSEQDDHWRTVRDALLISCAGCALFGAALGAYGMSFAQIAYSALKVPLLLIGTTALCFPVFFVLQAVREAHPLSLARAAAVQSLALAVIGVIWGAFAPPLLFLVTSTSQYKLAQVLALLIGTVGGAVGLGRFFFAQKAASHSADSQSDSGRQPVIMTYFVLFAAVGGQLAWVLRPFIGDPSLPPALFRERGGNMFSHILAMLGVGS